MKILRFAALLFVLSPVIIKSVRDYTVFTAEGPKRLEDYVQDGLSRLSGEKNYNRLDPDERRRLLNSAVMRVYRHCGPDCYSSCANRQIQEELADFVCQKMYHQCYQQGQSLNQSEKISKKIRASIQEKINNNQSAKWKYGLANGTFDNYLGENNIYEIQRACEQLEKQQKQQEIKNNDAVAAGVVGFITGFFTGVFAGLWDDKKEQRPTSVDQTPVPSAPVDDCVSVYPKKFYVQEECCSCMERFGQGQHERIFFSCGHSVCKGEECIGWVMEHKSCPQCRKNLEKELFNIQRAADNAAYCCACGNHENNMVKMRQCAHKVCRNCCAGWQKTGSRNYCPKCNVRQ